MEPKKNPEVNLERKRGLFLQIGFVIALLVVLGAFEYKTYEKIIYDLGPLDIGHFEEEFMENTKQEEKKKQPPPPPPEVIEIVEDDVVIEKEIEIEETDSDEEDEIKIEEDYNEEVFTVVESMPKFKCMKFRRKEICGELGLMTFFAENTKYPTIAQEYGISGKVYVSFVVTKSGAVTNVKVVRGVNKHLDAEAVRVIKSLPNFWPGKQRGKPVKVMFTVPITFDLQ